MPVCQCFTFFYSIQDALEERSRLQNTNKQLQHKLAEYFKKKKVTALVLTVLTKFCPSHLPWQHGSIYVKVSFLQMLCENCDVISVGCCTRMRESFGVAKQDV